jgi:hypothetical protein
VGASCVTIHENFYLLAIYDSGVWGHHDVSSQRAQRGSGKTIWRRYSDSWVHDFCMMILLTLEPKLASWGSAV